MRVAPLDAALGEHTTFGAPIAEAKAHTTRFVVQQRISLSLDFLVDFLPMWSALYGIEHQGASALLYVIFVADVFDIDETLQFGDVG